MSDTASNSGRLAFGVMAAYTRRGNPVWRDTVGPCRRGMQTRFTRRVCDGRDMGNMLLSLEEMRAGLRDGSVIFCLPAAHENFTSEFLEDFSARILKQNWTDVASRTHLHIPALLDHNETEDDLAATIRDEYGADVSDLPGLPLWEVIRRCARPRP